MRRTSMLVFVVFLGFAIALPAQDSATQQQPTVTRHWSRNPYPTTFPETARIYIIVKGDTLWDISQRFYNNPLLWPHLHAANPYIKDPHWIYPEDPLVMPDLAVAEPGTIKPESQAAGEEAAGPATGEARQDDQGAPGAEAEARIPTPEEMAAAGEVPTNFEEGVMFETEPRPSREYIASARDLDLYCASMVYPEKLPTDLYVAGREEAGQIEIQQFDIVYLNEGKNLLKPGDLLIASNYVDSVNEPVHDTRVGYVYQEVGVVRVLIVTEDHAVAEVMASCDGLRVGSLLTPFEKRPNPMIPVRQTFSVDEQYFEYDRSTVGNIVYINYQGYESAAGDVVNINLGSDQGLNIGDTVLVVRSTELENLYKNAAETTKDWESNDDYQTIKPKVKVVGRAFGEGVVLRVTRSTAAVKLTYTVDFPRLGNAVIPAKRAATN